MSNVRLEIGGREFSVACAPGEEAHIAALGEQIDGKLRAMGGTTGQSESRTLLFAALLLADEVHELKHREGAPPPPPPPPPQPVEDHGPALTRLVEGIESAAATLEKLADTLEAAARRA